LPTGCGIRRLRRRHLDASKGETRPGEQVAEGIAEGLCTDRNCKGNEHDQHGVFGSGGAALITTKSTGQTVHFNILLQGVTLWPVCAKGDHSRHSASSQTNPVAVSGLSCRRQKSAFCDLFYSIVREREAAAAGNAVAKI